MAGEKQSILSERTYHYWHYLTFDKHKYYSHKTATLHVGVSLVHAGDRLTRVVHVTRTVNARDVKFGIQIESDWPQMRQIWDFLRSVSVHFECQI